MKSRVPKEREDLTPAARAKVEKYCLEKMQEQEEKDMRIILELFIKMNCALMHDLFGKGEKSLTLYIGNLQMMFREQCNLVSRGEQLRFLDDRMAKIFRKDGFPQSFVDNMLGPKDEATVNGEGLML